jgi:hypothetical protein
MRNLDCSYLFLFLFLPKFAAASGCGGGVAVGVFTGSENKKERCVTQHIKPTTRTPNNKSKSKTNKTKSDYRHTSFIIKDAQSGSKEFPVCLNDRPVQLDVVQSGGRNLLREVKRLLVPSTRKPLHRDVSLDEVL